MYELGSFFENWRWSALGALGPVHWKGCAAAQTRERKRPGAGVLNLTMVGEEGEMFISPGRWFQSLCACGIHGRQRRVVLSALEQLPPNCSCCPSPLRNFASHLSPLSSEIPLDWPLKRENPLRASHQVLQRSVILTWLCCMYLLAAGAQHWAFGFAPSQPWRADPKGWPTDELILLPQLGCMSHSLGEWAEARALGRLLHSTLWARADMQILVEKSYLNSSLKLLVVFRCAI